MNEHNTTMRMVEGNEFGLSESERADLDVIEGREPLGTRIVLEVVQRSLKHEKIEMKLKIAEKVAVYALRRLAVHAFVMAYEREIVSQPLLSKTREDTRRALQNPAICVSNPELEETVIHNKKLIAALDAFFGKNPEFAGKWEEDIAYLRRNIPSSIKVDFLTDQFLKGLLFMWLKSIRMGKDWKSDEFLDALKGGV